MNSINLNNYEAFLLDYSEGTLNEKDSVLLRVFVRAHPELEIDLQDFDLPYIDKESHKADFKNSLRRSASEVQDEALLNYLEGNLPLEQHLAFEIKLSRDKDLEKDLVDYKKTISVADENQVFEFKTNLQKTEDDLVLNNRLIAYLENQFSATEKAQFEQELNANADLKKKFVALSKTILSSDLSLVYPDKNKLKKENRVIALFSLRTFGSMAAAIMLFIGLAFIYNYYNSTEEVKGGLATKKDIPGSTTPATPELKNTTGLKIIPFQPLSAEPLSTNIIPTKSIEKTLANVPAKKQIDETTQEQAPIEIIEKQVPEITKTNEKVEVILKENLPLKETKYNLATAVSKSTSVDSMTKQNYLLVAEDVETDDDFLDSKNTIKNGLWKRAVQFAQKANKLGVKSIDGEENSESKYRLSFNSFSVEKK